MDSRAFIFLACLKKGYSSSVLGHLVKYHASGTNKDSFLYYSCIRLCRKTRKCVGITFRESTSDCWLKASVKHEPRNKRSFLVMDCLKKPASVLYQGYSDKVYYTFKKTTIHKMLIIDFETFVDKWVTQPLKSLCHLLINFSIIFYKLLTQGLTVAYP